MAANKKINRELLNMARADQAMRAGKRVWSKERDQQRAQRLAEIITRYGWPNETIAGNKGAAAAWLIAQHADFNVKLQTDFLKLLKESVRGGGAPAWQAAYLADRVRVNQGRLQLYGTQFRSNKHGILALYPVHNRKQLDMRRKRVGLESMSVYRRRILSKPHVINSL